MRVLDSDRPGYHYRMSQSVVYTSAVVIDKLGLVTIVSLPTYTRTSRMVTTPWAL